MNKPVQESAGILPISLNTIGALLAIGASVGSAYFAWQANEVARSAAVLATQANELARKGIAVSTASTEPKLAVSIVSAQFDKRIAAVKVKLENQGQMTAHVHELGVVLLNDGTTATIVRGMEGNLVYPSKSAEQTWRFERETIREGAVHDFVSESKLARRIEMRLRYSFYEMPSEIREMTLTISTPVWIDRTATGIQ